jgi:hypothetical protein
LIHVDTSAGSSTATIDLAIWRPDVRYSKGYNHEGYEATQRNTKRLLLPLAAFVSFVVKDIDSIRPPMGRLKTSI